MRVGRFSQVQVPPALRLMGMGTSCMSRRDRRVGASSASGDRMSRPPEYDSHGRLLQTDAGEDAVEPSAVKRSSTLGFYPYA